MRRTLKGILGLAAVFSLTVAGGRYTFAQTGAQSEKTSSGIVIETRAADKDNESEKAAETAKNIESGKAADVAKKAESGETADTEKAAETEKDKESEDTADVGKDKKSSENKNENEHGHSEEISEDHEVPEGVTVNGMELGGMTVKAAEEKLQQYVDEVCGGAVTLSVNGDEVTILYKDFDMHVADSTVIQDICQIGVNGNLIKRYKELSDVKNNKAEYTLNFEYDHDKLKELVDEDTAEYNKDAQNASLVRHSGEFIITDDVTGMKVDIDATTKAVEEALGDGWDGSSQKLDATVEDVKADHTSDELKQVTDLLGGYSTDYSSSSDNRIANIANGASLIDETVVYPGDTFSFLNHVTPFTASNGYYEATGYSAGRVVPSIGGGICQVSSTMYNAVLRAELEVVERSNHGLTVGYVPLGADATVAEGSVDFRFRNNLDAPIYIEAYTYGGEIYVNIYGHETRSSNRSIEFYSVTDKTIEPGEDVITKDDTQPDGWQEVTQSAHNGYVASFYKKIYVDGSLQDTVWINTSYYSASPRYITVGTKKDNSDSKKDDSNNKKSEEN